MNKKDNMPPLTFDWQGHRGARGLLPENTIPAFLAALSYPQIKTLELDVVITSDDVVIVSHEPWLSAKICSHPDGQPVQETEQNKLNIRQMTLAQVQTFDCGRRAHPDFPEQKPMSVCKPTLTAIIEAAEAESLRLKRPLPYYNIEIKSQVEWDEIFTPKPMRFAQLLLAVLEETGISERTCVQSFDPRSLRALRILAPQQTIAYLIANEKIIADNLEELEIKPDIYSPYYKLVTPSMVDVLHQMEIQLIPWTVNEVEDMKAMIELGVDGIITDYPNRIPAKADKTQLN